MRILNRKRFSITILILLLTISSILIAYSLKFTKEPSRKDVAVSAGKEEKDGLAVGEDGNIFITENEYFRKYTIKCPVEQKEVNYTESKDQVTITLADNVSLKINSKSSDKYSIGSIKVGNDKDKKIINIKKEYSSNNFVYIDNVDRTSIIIMTSKKENPYAHTVVLDPGHGGVDKGVNLGELYEKDIVLKIAKFAVNELRYRGCNVLLTRDSDNLLSLSEVADFVNNSSAEVFLSIHINSFPQDKYQGIGTYYYEDGTFQKEERLKFAKIIEKYAVKDDGWMDRGIFKDKLKVLRLSKVPCALVECGFLTNSNDKARLTDDKVLSNLARNLSEGIAEYLNNK